MSEGHQRMQTEAEIAFFEDYESGVVHLVLFYQNQPYPHHLCDIRNTIEIVLLKTVDYEFCEVCTGDLQQLRNRFLS